MPLRRIVNSRHHQFVRNHDLADCVIPVAMGVMDDESIKNAQLCVEVWGYEYGKRKKRIPNLSKHFLSGKLDKINPKLTHVEAFVHAEEKICAVQWHPEDLHYRHDPFKRGDFVTHRMITWLLSSSKTPALVGIDPKFPAVTVTTETV